MFLIICLVTCILPKVLCEDQPNFVVFLTDDQDLLLHSVDYMPKTIKHIANEGVTFTNFFVNSPVCCPSRSTILTGKYAHNLQVFNNSLNGGCSNLSWQNVHEKLSVASILKDKKNYTNFYAGKYLNEYGSKQAGGIEHVPPGYDWWMGLQGNSKYYNYTLSVNGSARFFQDDYLTDKITNYALNFLDSIAHTPKNNFFMVLAPPACHSPWTPASRHIHLFPDLRTPRLIPFNSTPFDKHWIVEMPPNALPDDVTILDNIFKNRLRTLQAVDEMVKFIIKKLIEIQQLDNTFVMFFSDNGFHIGQFTQPWDKRQPYESDIRVPFFIRGPKVSKKSISHYPMSAVDLAPTVLDLAGIKDDHDFDGKSFKKVLFNPENDSYNKHILIEYWGEGNARTIDPQCFFANDDNLAECTKDAWCKCQDSKNNTYSCILELTNSNYFKFCEFDTGFIEAYDLVADPFELHNLELEFSKKQQFKNLLGFMKTCKGKKCQI